MVEISSKLIGPPAEFLRAAAAVTAEPPPVAAAPTKPPPPKKRLTENASPTFASSGDPCLDFFLHVAPGTPAARVASLLADAWAAEPTTALRLACNLVGVRGTSKSDRQGFYAAALWMHERHPATLALNAPSIVELGYLKVLPEILHRIVQGAAAAVSTGRRPGKKAEARVTGAAMGFLRLGKEECAAAFKELERKIDRRWRAEAAVTAGQKGVAMVSGSSKNLVKLFLDNDGILTPRAIMEKAISGPEHQKLIVYD